MNPIKPLTASIIGINDRLDSGSSVNKRYTPKMHTIRLLINPITTLTFLLMSNTSKEPGELVEKNACSAGEKWGLLTFLLDYFYDETEQNYTS